MPRGFCRNVCSRKTARPVLAGLALSPFAMLTAFASPALAQDEGNGAELAAEAEAPLRVCGAAWAPGTAEAGEDGAQSVHALCWGTWLALGSAEAFRYTFNFDLEATIVELTRGGEPVVLLIRPDGEGRPFIENLGSVLADAAGRTRLGNLEGLAFDYDAFAFTGQIGVASDAAPSAAEPEAEASGASADAGGVSTTTEAQPAPASFASVAIGEHIAADRARLAASEGQ